MPFMLIALITVGYLARRLRRGWLAVPLVLVSAPLVFTLIGAFDDGESWIRRAAFGAILAVPVAVGLLLGTAVSHRRTTATPPIMGQTRH